jgi:polyisoprenoid-binding protein YceI
MANAGTHAFGPDNSKLMVRTFREGAAAKLGHDLVLEVTSWQGVVEIADDGSVSKAEVTADSNSLEVREGTGGVKALGDKDRADIKSTIEKKVLQGRPISFHSTDVKTGGEGSYSIRGDLELGGNTGTVTFLLGLDAEGRPSATAQVTQSDWGIKPYTGMMGALKVRDTVDVELSAR